MPISERNGRLIVGFYEKDSHSPVNMTRCLLHGEWADAVIKAVRDYAEFCGVSAYDERTGKGILRHLVARNIDGHIAVTVVINAQNLPKYSELVRFIEYSIKDFSLHISVNTKNTNVILGDTIRTLYGDPRAVYTAEGIRASVSPLSFLQVNDEVRSMIYREVSGLTKGAEIIIDAYSGSGLMTALLSRNAVKAYGIELVSDAVSDAERLMKDNGISNVENLCGDAAKLLPPLIKNLADKKITVVLDPPRKGCEIAVIDALKLALPEKIVYISCNPATLARDISLLKERYTIVSVTPYDMFPNTKHIETVACLKLKIES
jgi:23S rRNA (uracil1939-C5)-methyltransferase